jgi:hypothetical protein
MVAATRRSNSQTFDPGTSPIGLWSCAITAAISRSSNMAPP